MEALHVPVRVAAARALHLPPKPEQRDVLVVRQRRVDQGPVDEGLEVGSSSEIRRHRKRPRLVVAVPIEDDLRFRGAIEIGEGGHERDPAGKEERDDEHRLCIRRLRDAAVHPPHLLEGLLRRVSRLTDRFVRAPGGALTGQSAAHAA